MANVAFRQAVAVINFIIQAYCRMYRSHMYDTGVFQHALQVPVVN